MFRFMAVVVHPCPGFQRPLSRVHDHPSPGFLCTPTRGSGDPCPGSLLTPVRGSSAPLLGVLATLVQGPLLTPVRGSSAPLLGVLATLVQGPKIPCLLRKEVGRPAFLKGPDRYAQKLELHHATDHVDARNFDYLNLQVCQHTQASTVLQKRFSKRCFMIVDHNKLPKQSCYRTFTPLDFSTTRKI